MPSLYDISIPVFIRGLRNMDAFLDKGAAHFAAAGRPESELTTARLYEDMAPLTAQIQRASDAAKGTAVRVGGVETIVLGDGEVTIADLKARIAATIAFLEKVPHDAFDGKEDATVELALPSKTWMFTGQSYVLEFALPNFFFHVTTAYALLRKEGVPVGKADYLGAIEVKPH
jgi:hypothetical protein